MTGLWSFVHEPVATKALQLPGALILGALARFS